MNLRLLTRVALFAALIYVLSMATAFLPNVKLIFFLVFSAGFLWGIWAGLLVGGIGMSLWTIFNPFGPAGIPVMVAQILGAAAGGPVGYLFSRLHWRAFPRVLLYLSLGLCGLICTLVFYLPVTIVDAWLYQPFWPRIIAGLPWVGFSLVSNMLVFPLLFGATKFLYDREKLA